MVIMEEMSKMSDRIQLIREAHIKVLAQEGGSIEELLPATQEDVEDESSHLDALDHIQEVDFDSDENEVDMNTMSPQMKEIFAWLKLKKMKTSKDGFKSFPLGNL